MQPEGEHLEDRETIGDPSAGMDVASPPQNARANNGRVGTAPVVRGMAPETFLALYREQVIPVYRYCYQQTGNVHDAEDLLGTTLCKAFAGRATFDPGRGTFAAWLFGIARHVLRDFRRGQRPLADVAGLDPPPADAAPSLDMQVVRAEQGQLLHARVLRLPPAQRDAVCLRYFGGLRVAEIAAVLGRSEGAVSLLIHRAFATLRSQYLREER